ncbi:MAG: hypothetical protein ACRESK_06685 [Gammaproteobacteria bacterium]
MRILINIFFLPALISMNAYAVEPVDEQQMMLYYEIPLGAGKPQDGKHQFGLRFDQVSQAPGQDVHNSTLQGKTAAMDFRMGYDGIKTLKIHGVDYASYLIARAAAEDKAPAEAAPAATEAASPEAPPAEGETTETAEAPQEQKGPVQEKLDALPFGVVIGVIIGIGFIAGVGG